VEIGIDSFAGGHTGDIHVRDNELIIDRLMEQIQLADKVGLDVFGIGEHHRREFLDSANHMLLSAAARITKNIRLTSAVTVLSAADPVRVFQNFATLDLLSKGRAEIVAGRGSFTEAFPLFGIDQREYSEVFQEKLNLLLQIRDNVRVNWKGNYRPSLIEQEIYPRPIQEKFPIWRGAGGSPQSFQMAGLQGLPLMIAIIGGETRRFAPLVELYRKAYNSTKNSLSEMKVGIHSFGYVAENRQKAIDEFFPGYKRMFDRIGKERGWGGVTMDRFLFQNGPNGAYLVGDVEEVANKIVTHSMSLGGLSRFQFQIENELLTHEQIMNSIEMIGLEVKPRVLEILNDN